MTGLSVVTIDPLDAATARAVGVVSGRAAGVTPLEVGHVVVSARARGWPVLAVDATPFLAAASDVMVETLP